MVLLPPRSRLKGSLVDHFREHSDLYVDDAKNVERVHVVSVTHDHERVVDYVLKTVLNGRLEQDDAILVLPRTGSELRGDLCERQLTLLKPERAGR